MIELYAPIFAGSVALTALLLWALCTAAPYLGLVDHPQGRKAHSHSTPLVGGVAILSGSVLAALAVMVAQGRGGNLMAEVVDHLGFVIGGAGLMIMGVVDDWRPIPARYKLLIQLLCCAVAVYLDQVMVGEVGIFIGHRPLSIGPIVGPFSVLVMLTITNSINMIDGADGLAGGITLVAFAVMAKAMTAAGFTSAPYVIALIGALVAFLAFNFPIRRNHKALAFLGDSGSLLFGFAVGYMAIELSALPGRVFKPSTALWFFFIPVADTIWIYLRRMWVARAPFSAGRDHIHHQLMEYFSPRFVTWILVGSSTLLAGGAYFAERKGVDNSVMILSWIGAFLLYGLVTTGPWRRAWDKSRTNEALAAAGDGPLEKVHAEPAPAVATAVEQR